MQQKLSRWDLARRRSTCNDRLVSREKKNDLTSCTSLYNDNLIQLKDASLTSALFCLSHDGNSKHTLKSNNSGGLLQRGISGLCTFYHQLTGCQRALASSHTKPEPHVWHTVLLTTTRARARNCCVHVRVVQLPFHVVKTMFELCSVLCWM